MITTETAVWLVRLASVYLLAGVLFAFPFVQKGAGRLDSVAKNGTWGFRTLIFPGAVALWPWLAWRLARGGPPADRNAHRDRAR